MPFVNKEEFLKADGLSINDGRFKPVHGHTSSRTGKTVVSGSYQSWNRMKDRVLNPKHVAYARYGGRGITVCDKWLTFTGFLDDMGERPEGLTLERRNNDLGYSKDNCYWATPKQQSRNTHTNLLLEFHGVKRPAVEWAERFFLPRHVVYARIKAGWSTERILLTELDLRFSHRGLRNAVHK